MSAAKNVVALNTTRVSLAPTTISEALEFSAMLAKSTMVPKDYLQKPENVFVCIQMGMELGVAPMQALQNIAVINGRPSVWGDLALAICKTHPQWGGIEEKSDDKGAICVVARVGEPNVTQAFSQADAARAGLWGKQGPWSQYPRRMMQMRARAFALRDQFPDALKGIAIREEVEDTPAERDITPGATTTTKSSSAKLRGALGISSAPLNDSQAAGALLENVLKAFRDAPDEKALNAAVESAKVLSTDDDKQAAGVEYKAACTRLNIAPKKKGKAEVIDAAAGDGKQPTAGAPSVAEISDAIQKAANEDELAAAQDLIQHAPEQFRGELEADVVAKQAQLPK